MAKEKRYTGEYLLDKAGRTRSFDSGGKTMNVPLGERSIFKVKARSRALAKAKGKK